MKYTVSYMSVIIQALDIITDLILKNLKLVE